MEVFYTQGGRETGDIFSFREWPSFSPKPRDLSPYSNRRWRLAEGSRQSHIPNIKENHHARLGAYTASMWKENCMTDVLVTVQGVEFAAHKAVLACYSPYFNEALTKPGVNNVHTVDIPSVTSTAFQILLTYMYTGELKVSCQDLSDVYRAARRLGMTDALDRCIQLLQITRERLGNTFYLYVTAKKLDLLDACMRAYKLMTLHFEEMVHTSEFLDLEPDQVVDFLSADDIGARSEIMVFLAALRWLDHKFLHREGHAVTIISCVRFPLMNLEEVLACFHPPILPAVIEFPEIKESLLLATSYVAAKSLSQENLFLEMKCKPRNYLLQGQPCKLWSTAVYDPEQYPQYRRELAATKIQATVRGYLARIHFEREFVQRSRAATIIQAHYRGYKTRESFNFGRKNRKIVTKGKKPISRSLPGQVWLHTSPDRCPAFRPSGLFSKEEKQNIFMRSTGVSPEQKKCLASSASGPLNRKKNDSSLPTKKSNSIVLSTTSDERNESGFRRIPVIYAMGGFDKFNVDKGNILFCFNPNDNSWKEVVVSQRTTYDVKIVLLKDSIYCIGGCDVSKMNPRVRNSQPICTRYDLQTQQWYPVQSMNHARIHHGVVVLNGVIHVVGGKNEAGLTLSSVEKYDLTSNTWKLLPTCLPFPRMCMGVAPYLGMLCVVGGAVAKSGHITMVDNFDCYDPHVKKWMKKAKFPKVVGFVTLVTCNEKLFALGGAVPCKSSAELMSVSDVYVYDNVNNCWNSSVPLPVPCHSIAATASDNNIYVFGGITTFKGSMVLHEVFCFDTVQRLWWKCCRVPESAYGIILSATSQTETTISPK